MKKLCGLLCNHESFLVNFFDDMFKHGIVQILYKRFFGNEGKDVKIFTANNLSNIRILIVATSELTGVDDVMHLSILCPTTPSSAM